MEPLGHGEALEVAAVVPTATFRAVAAPQARDRRYPADFETSAKGGPCAPRAVWRRAELAAHRVPAAVGFAITLPRKVISPSGGLAAISCLLALTLAGLAGGLRAQPAAPDLAVPTFEELGKITVSTVSRRAERFFRVPAAMSVVTRETVHLTGALTLPEALREVPGLNVAQINADAWAIGTRGFQWQFANKLLVMIDGRSIYSPIAGGVPWEDNPVFLEDLDRVEVVRGPGSTFWGANAVNGVINIVSRSAFETLGTFVAAGSGNRMGAMVAARQGFRLSEHAAVRVFAQSQRHDENVLPTGAPAGDAYRLGFGGMRLDWNPDPGNTLTLQTGFHDRRTDYVRPLPTLSQPPTYTLLSTDPVHGRGQYVSGEWSRDWTSGANLYVRTYWDRKIRNRPQDGQTITTGDVDSIYNAQPVGRHVLSAGLGYRRVNTDVDSRLYVYDPEDNRSEIFTGFLHDDITLQPGRMRLKLGAKFEHHRSTGWNAQPSMRLMWLPNPNTTVWGSIGRAVRAPTLIEQTAAFDARAYPPGVLDPILPATIRIFGNPDLKTEKMTAFEAGFRLKSATGWTLDLAGFAYDYRDYVIITTDRTFTQSQPPARVLGQRFVNGIVGESYGGELTLQWDPRPWWRLGASCNYVQIQLRTTRPDPFGYQQDEDTTPRTSVMVTSDWRLGSRWALHAAGRYIDPVRYYGIPAYTEVDARLAFQVNEQFEASLVGRNLLAARHPEYDSALSRRLTELPRAFYFSVKWKK